MKKYLFGLMAIISLTLVGCGGESAPDTPNNNGAHSDDDGHDHGADHDDHDDHEDDEDHEGHDH